MMGQTNDSEAIKDFLSSNLPLFLSFSLLDIPLNASVSDFEDIYFGEDSLVIKQGGHLRPIFPLKKSLLHFFNIMKNNEKIKKLEDKLSKNILIELKRNEVTNNSIRDAIIFEFVHKLKTMKKKTHFLIARNSLPIINKWLDGVMLPYKPLDVEFQGEWNGKIINYSLLNICIWCFDSFNGSVPDDNLCREKQNCHDKYRSWLERKKNKESKEYVGIQKYVNSSRKKLIKFYLLDSKESHKLLKFEGVQKDIQSIVSMFQEKILKAEKIFEQHDFCPFYNPEKDKCYPADEKSQIYRDLVKGIRENSNNIIQGVINNHGLKTYELNRLLFKLFHIKKNRERMLKRDSSLIEFLLS